MDASVIRRQYTRTISKNIRSLDILNHSFDDVAAQWRSLLEKISASGLNSLSSALKKEVESISSQVRCIQQELVTYLVVHNDELGNFSSQGSSLSSVHRDVCTRGSLHQGANRDAQYFCTITTSSYCRAQLTKTTNNVAERSEQSSQVMRAKDLGLRVWVFAVWMSIALGDFDWLTTSISGVEEYWINTQEKLCLPAEQESDKGITRLFFYGESLQAPPDTPTDKWLMSILLLWYHCFAGEMRKATDLYFIINDDASGALSDNLRKLVLNIAHCIVQADATQLFSVIICSTSFHTVETKCYPDGGCQIFPLSLFLRFMAEIFLRPILVNKGIDKTFRPVVSLEVNTPEGLEAPPRLTGMFSPEILLSPECTTGERISSMLQDAFFREKAGPWPFPQQMWKSMMTC